ncbi:hypothetical protein CS006_10455 [Bifidobacterium primatium]|uniref:Uncharacterized protein n=2 Tax=Bifidobacterium TaxID=1678 RepID=A0A2M9H6C4_9BIFI|nr:hypothetical protein [Bifidobacterium sp. SMB2]NEH12464.1 hypothetical protein [Bifidobacterium saimiriisciurei]PJM72372.1 hypothetical protein CS006_10455 [Bifidobacterium primatium]
MVGVCPECGREVTAAKTESLRVCRCGALVDIDRLREETAEAADKYHLTRTPAGLSAWLRENYGYDIGRKQIGHWIERGKLPSTRPVEAGYYEFSLREVLAMAMGYSKRQ